MTGAVGDAEAAGCISRRDPGAPGGNHDRQSEGVPDNGGDTTAVTRLGINYLSSARVRRETDVGDWLPEQSSCPPTSRGRLSTPSWRLRNGAHLTTLHPLASTGE
jgi:hypothetical protein